MREIIEVEERITTALGRGDAEAAAACYTEDAILMPPDRPALVGRAAIEAYFRGTLERFTLAIESTVEEVEAAGDWAYLRNRLHQRLTLRRGGKTLAVDAKALVVARRDADGSWRYHRDAFSGDRPPPLGGLLGRLQRLFSGR